MPNLLGIVIHQPDGWPSPSDRRLPLVFVSDSECLLTTQPPLVPWEKLKRPLYVVEHGILRVLQPRTDILHIEL